MNTQKLKISKFARRAALRGKMEESALHHYSIKFKVGVCPRSPWEVKLQGAAAHTPLSCIFNTCDTRLQRRVRVRSTLLQMPKFQFCSNSASFVLILAQIKVRSNEQPHLRRFFRILALSDPYHDFCHKNYRFRQTSKFSPKRPSALKFAGECFAPFLRDAFLK